MKKKSGIHLIRETDENKQFKETRAIIYFYLIVKAFTSTVVNQELLSCNRVSITIKVPLMVTIKTLIYLGKVLGYTIIVAEDYTNKPTELDPFLPGWRDVQQYSSWPPYQVYNKFR